MPQSLAKVLVHIVYSTKGRRPWLKDEEIRRQLYAYKAIILRDNVDTPALISRLCDAATTLRTTSITDRAGDMSMGKEIVRVIRCHIEYEFRSRFTSASTK